MSFVDYQGKLCLDSDNQEHAEQTYERFKSNSDEDVDISKLRFNDPNNFVAGNDNSKVLEWKNTSVDESLL